MRTAQLNMTEFLLLWNSWQLRWGEAVTITNSFSSLVLSHFWVVPPPGLIYPLARDISDVEKNTWCWWKCKNPQVAQTVSINAQYNRLPDEQLFFLLTTIPDLCLWSMSWQKGRCLDVHSFTYSTFVEWHQLKLSQGVEDIITSLYVVYEVSSSDI